MTTRETIPVTAEGHQRLNKELHKLKSEERPAVIEAIAEARSHGDLKENAEYHAAREKQGFIEARINYLEDRLSRAQVITFDKVSPDSVRFGAWVDLEDEESGEEKKFRIVGELEADIDNNLLSISSPMGKALLGKKLDDIVEIRVPKGIREYVIINIRYQKANN
ncbi:MAG: transcription elongation factor GreA [Zetaproteobacteria bacterium]|nr:transcription elongation factor GreA [Zetaproteobacteria bacterium]